jgi:hypothetical protein
MKKKIYCISDNGCTTNFMISQCKRTIRNKNQRICSRLKNFVNKKISLQAGKLLLTRTIEKEDKTPILASIIRSAVKTNREIVFCCS